MLPVITLKGTGRFAGSLQWFPTEKPLVSAVETDDFRQGNHGIALPRALAPISPPPLPQFRHHPCPNFATTPAPSSPEDGSCVLRYMSSLRVKVRNIS